MVPGISIIGELINHSFARAQRAWAARSLEAYQELAVLQKARGARCLTVNIQGTSRLAIAWPEVAAFLPRLVAALQEATDLPLAFDSPDIEYHRIALRVYDRNLARGEAPIINSLSASRPDLDDWLALVSEADTRALVMASEGFGPDGTSRANRTAADVHETAKWFAATVQYDMPYYSQKLAWPEWFESVARLFAGKRCAMNAPTTQLACHGTPEEVAVMVRQFIESTLPHTSAVVMPGCEIDSFAPLENVNTMIDTAREYAL
jgi:hypothetical protein